MQWNPPKPHHPTTQSCKALLERQSKKTTGRRPKKNGRHPQKKMKDDLNKNKNGRQYQYF
jgi:hypothetical protein